MNGMNDLTVRFLLALPLLVLVSGSQCHPAQRPASIPDANEPAVLAVASSSQSQLEWRAKADPLAFLKYCRRRYTEMVTDYWCRFRKRERVNGSLTTEQTMEVEFREHPFSVDMHWTGNTGRARRIRYVAGKYVENGRELAVIEPSGVLALLVPDGVKRDIHGDDVKRNARRTIDQFGFKNTLDLIIKYSELAEGNPRYSLRYVGRGEVDGRPTFVFERHLPYTRPDDPFPDRLLVIHVDTEWLVPTACLAYADDHRKELLGSYILTDVQFNVGLADRDF